MQPNPNAFPTKDTEFALVDYTGNDKYRNFDITQEEEQDDSKLEEHGVSTDSLNPILSFYEGPVPITDTLAADPAPMATFLWKNHSSEDVSSGYVAIYFLKRALVRGMLQAIDIWENENPLSQYKLGIEVKAIFAKNHPYLQQHGPGEPTKESCSFTRS